MTESLSQSLVTFDYSDQFNLSTINHNFDMMDNVLAVAVKDYDTYTFNDSMDNYSITDLINLCLDCVTKVGNNMVFNEQSDAYKTLKGLLGSTRNDIFRNPKTGLSLPARYIDFTHYITYNNYSGTVGYPCLIFTPITVSEWPIISGKQWTQFGTWSSQWQNWPTIQNVRNVVYDTFQSYLSNTITNLWNKTTQLCRKRDYRKSYMYTVSYPPTNFTTCSNRNPSEDGIPISSLEEVNYTYNTFVPSIVDLMGFFSMSSGFKPSSWADAEAYQPPDGWYNGGFSTRGATWRAGDMGIMGMGQRFTFLGNFSQYDSSSSSGITSYSTFKDTPPVRNPWPHSIDNPGHVYSKSYPNDYNCEAMDYYGYFVADGSQTSSGQPTIYYYPSRLAEDGWRCDKTAFPTGINNTIDVMTSMQWYVANWQSFMEEDVLVGETHNGPVYIQIGKGSSTNIQVDPGMYSTSQCFRPMFALGPPPNPNQPHV